MKRAKESDWKRRDFPAQYVTVLFNRAFTQDEMNLITMGIIPAEMEDKWFIYWKEERLYFHRSWTGACMYIVRFKQEGDYFKMYQADVNRDTEEYGETDNNRDIRSINTLIDRLLLKNKVSISQSGDELTDMLQNWSFYGRAMYGENKDG